MQKKAVIDWGSNALRLSIYDITISKEYEEIFYLRIPFRLVNFLEQNEVSNKTLEHIDHAFHMITNAIKEHHAVLKRAVATSAIRESSNPELIKKHLAKHHGILIEVISSEQEAIFSAMAVHRKCNIQPAIVFDLGGGSLDTALIENDVFRYLCSVDIGNVKLFRNNPDGLNVQKSADFYQKTIEEKLNKQCEILLKYKSYDLFFCGGNSNLICRLILGENKQNACQFLSSDDFFLWADILSKKTTQELVSDFNINTEKAETILPSILIYRELAKLFGKERIYIPYTGIREALIMD